MAGYGRSWLRAPAGGMTSIQSPKTDHPRRRSTTRPEVFVGVLSAFGSVGTALGLWLLRLPLWFEIPLVAVVVIAAGALFCRVMGRRYPDHPLFARQRRAERFPRSQT